jgi:hypothetical protein
MNIKYRIRAKYVQNIDVIDSDKDTTLVACLKGTVA